MNVPTLRSWDSESRLRLRVAAIEARPDPEPPDTLGRAVSRVNPDFCLVQNLLVPFAEPWLEALAGHAGMHLISGPNLVLGNGDAGLALLTRHAPLQKRFVDLSIPPVPANGAMDLDFEVDGRAIRIAAVQLSDRPDEHAVQIENLHAMLTRRTQPALVLGRFSVSDLRPGTGKRGGGPLSVAGWLGRAPRQDQRVRIASFPPYPLDAVPLIPVTRTMIAFEVSAPEPDLEAGGKYWSADRILAAVGAVR